MVRRSVEAAGRWRRQLAVLVVVGVLAAVAVLAAPGRATDAAGDRSRQATAAAPTSGSSPTPRPTSLVPDPSTTTTAPDSTASAPPVCDRRAELDAPGADVPAAAWVERVDDALDDPAWGGIERSISVWVEGYGEVVAVNPDLALLPASNQKLFTALGVRALLDPAARFRTVVRRSGDHLVLVAGGDPTLRRRGSHSLAALAEQVRASGVERVAGVLVDASAFDPATTARGWQDWQVPTYVGPMSALVVDDNRIRTDAGYLADPALGNADAFAVALRAAGVEVEGTSAHGTAAPEAPVVAALDSPTVAELTHDMLLRSDNEIAEALVREVGDGSTDAGLARTTAALEPWCLHLAGAAGDGSGLSRENRRSAREWRRLLQVAGEQPWADDVVAGLPVAGRTGTLGGRLTGPSTNGNVRAKTGSIIGGSALSGYATTSSGRAVVFSVIVNGEPAAASRAAAAIDRLVHVVVTG